MDDRLYSCFYYFLPIISTLLVLYYRKEIGEILKRINSVRKQLLNVTAEVTEIESALLKLNPKTPALTMTR